MGLFVAATLFATWWDVVQDWGLGNPEHGFLHERQMYPKRAYYYVAMVTDLLLRFAWVYSLIPPEADHGLGRLFAKSANWLAPLSMVLEMARRAVWAIFKVSLTSLTIGRLTPYSSKN